jgi:hypothetical protein
VKENFAAYDGGVLQLPADAVLPGEKFITVHREIVFKK